VHYAPTGELLKAGIYLGQEKIELRDLPMPPVGENDVLVQNLYSSVCGTDVAVFFHRPNTGHKVTVGSEFGHETVSRVVKVGKNVTDFTVGERVYPYPRYAKGDTRRAGTIGIAAAVALKHFGMGKVMLCDRAAFRLKLAEGLGFAVCNPAAEDFAAKAAAYFGTAPSLSGATADIDCWLDAAGAKSILEDFLRLGKIESQFVSVAVNNQPRTIDLLHMTYAQQSLIGSGGYMPEDAQDVQEILASGKWDLERIITHEFPLPELEQAIRTAGDAEHAGNVVVKMKTA